MILIVVTVPAACLLAQVDCQFRPAFIFNRRFRHKHRLTRHVPSTWPSIYTPGCFIFTVNRKLYGTSDSSLFCLIKIGGIQLLFGQIHICRCPHNLHRLRLVFTLRRSRFHREFRQRPSAFGGSTRPILRQIRIVQQLQPKPAHALQISLHSEFGGVLGRRITGC